MGYLEEFEYESIDEKWSSEDKMLFQTVFSLYGKNFEKVRCWLGHKSIKELVEYYYFLKSKKQIVSPGNMIDQIIHSNTIKSK